MPNCSNMVLSAALLFGLGFSGPKVLGQEVPSAAFLVGVGVGEGDLGIDGVSTAFHGGLTISAESGKTLTLRGAFVRTAPPGQSNDPNGWDVGVLVGRQVRSSRTFAAVRAGVAFVGNEYVGYDTSHTIGLPVEASVGLGLASVVWVTGSAFANINRDRSFLGFSLGLAVGKVR